MYLYNHCKYNEKLNIVTSSLIIETLFNKTSFPNHVTLNINRSNQISECSLPLSQLINFEIINLNQV